MLLLVTLVSPVDEAVTVIVAAVVYVKSLKVATPATAAFDVLPDAKLPLEGATVTVAVELIKLL